MTTTEKMDAERLARKVRWEGALLGAHEYGIRADQISDPALAANWAELQDAYDRLEPLMELMSESLGVTA